MRTKGLTSLAGWASIGAGAIHATAAGVHSDHRQALWVFIALALFQIGWGALALGVVGGEARPWAGRLTLLAGAAGNAAAVGGWVLAKTNGISFVDGLEEAEKVQAADGIAAGLAAVAALAALVALMALVAPGASAVRDGRPVPLLSALAAVATVGLAVPAMVNAGGHSHAEGADGHAHGHGAGAEPGSTSEAAGTTAHSHGGSPVPYDPTQPIDLSGTPGVTPEQQARAENLIAITLARLPQWSDTAVAEAAGYRSIGDEATGDEHFINWSLIDDETTLDPDHPESLVYRVERDGTRTLEAVMFMLPSSVTLDTVPDVGGALTQWHVHNDLCFTTPPDAKVVAIVDEDENCRPPLSKAAAVPMLHVWIEPHACGPFASLDGIGAGQVREGDERMCDHLHTSG